MIEGVFLRKGDGSKSITVPHCAMNLHTNRQVHKVKFAIRREGNADTRMQAVEETLHLA